MLNDYNIPEIISISRNSLYYNKFKYRVIIRVTGAYLTRRAKNIDEYIEFANYVQSRNLIKQDALLFSETIEVMKRFLSLKDSGYEFQKRIERNDVTIFFNEIELLNLIADVAPIEYIDVVDHYDVSKLYIRNPKYKYRTYIKAVNYKTDKETLKTFVDYASKINDISCSKAIGYAVNSKTKASSFTGYRYYYYFRAGHIDYNDENILSIIGLYLGPMIKKTVELVRKTK